MFDYTCLAEGVVFPASFKETGINQNEIIVGPTGGGKTVSICEPRICHTMQSSLVVPLSKRALKEKYGRMLKERGYEVIDLDFVNPEKCEIGYDPLDFVRTEEDVVQLARNLVSMGGTSSGRTGTVDPYWNDSATSVLGAEIALILLNAKDSNKKACFGDVVELHHSLKVEQGKKELRCNLDTLFEAAERMHPGNQASSLWNTIKGLAYTTASCILSIVNNAMDKIFSKKVIDMTRKEERINFRELGEKKVVAFITTSPMNQALLNLINVLYADLFRELFMAAEQKDNNCLNVPVHIICDDFACSGKIAQFENHISIFRAAGISVTLLLQSESQLTNMYGEQAATTIINNCDTYVYMGGMDIMTCKNVSQRINKPLHTIMTLPLEQVIVFRRGAQPVVARRYQTYEDPIYQKYIQGKAFEENEER